MRAFGRTQRSYLDAWPGNLMSPAERAAFNAAMDDPAVQDLLAKLDLVDPRHKVERVDAIGDFASEDAPCWTDSQRPAFACPGFVPARLRTRLRVVRGPRPQRTSSFLRFCSSDEFAPAGSPFRPVFCPPELDGSRAHGGRKRGLLCALTSDRGATRSPGPPAPAVLGDTAGSPPSPSQHRRPPRRTLRARQAAVLVGPPPLEDVGPSCGAHLRAAVFAVVPGPANLGPLFGDTPAAVRRSGLAFAKGLALTGPRTLRGSGSLRARRSSPTRPRRIVPSVASWRLSVR